MPKQDQQLALLDDPTPSKPSEALTGRLGTVLRTAADWREATKTIRSSRDLLEQAREIAPMVESAIRPMDSNEVYEGMKPCILLWGPPINGADEDGPAAAGAWLATWTTGLRELTVEALRVAVDEHIRTSKYFPRIAEIVTLGKRHATDQKMMAYRLRKALEADADKIDPAKAPTSEQRKAGAEELKALAETLRQKKMNVFAGSDLKPYRERENYSPLTRELISAGAG